MNQSETVRAHLTRLTIICFAIVSGVLIFSGVVAYLITSGAFPPEGSDMPSYFGTVFNLVAFVALVKAHFLPGIFAKPPQSAPEEDFLSWHLKSTIVAFAFREGAALIALVGIMLTGQLVGGIIMVGLALMTMILGWPRAEQIENAMTGI